MQKSEYHIRIMIKIRLYNPIANKDNAWWYSWDGESGVFSLDYVQRVFKENPDEKDFQFNIHCLGGEVEEGLAIYDFLRTSGRNIFMNIEGGCHSMAVTLLLAAPAENRSANPNAVALIHEVQGGVWGATSDVQATASDMKMLQDQILDIYADRTGTDRAVLEAIMKEQKEHNAKELLQLGFISKINSYNTNFKFNAMSKENKTLVQKAGQLLNRLQGLLGGQPSVNYDFTDDQGNVVFSTEEDDDTLEVGMAASPDGTFTIADGRTVTIEGGVITEITEAEGEGEEAPAEEETVENLRSENAELRNALNEATSLIGDLRKELKSNYVPARRVNSPSNRGTSSREETKKEFREKFKNAKKK